MEHICRDQEVDRKGDRVYDRRDQGTCHYSGVKAEPVGKKRQEASDRLSEQNDQHQSAAYDGRDLESDSVQQHKLYKVTDGKCDAAERSDPDLFPERLQRVAKLDLLQGNTTDDRYTLPPVSISMGI